jgi:hypothetical protein
MIEKKKGAIWVSTVLYILITIAVLGMAFAALKPEIDRMRDKAIIEQSLEMMNNIDETFNQVNETQGTKRQIQIQLKKGNLIFDCGVGYQKKIAWEFETNYKYSEVGTVINIGNIKALTEQAASGYKVSLYLEYDNILFDESDVRKVFTAGELPYTFFIENMGEFIDITSS